MFGKKWLTLPATVAAAASIVPETKSNNDKLLLVHIFHRHGDRTPWYSIHKSQSTWTPIISQQYTSFDQETHESLVEDVHSWQNIASKLRNITLTYKHDNWDKSSPTIFHSIDHKDKLSEIQTVDNAKFPYLGQLTDKGVEQMENVGKLLRNRYVETMKYLPNEYDPNENNLHYHSTNMARTIQSADCVLHGLYPLDCRKNECLIPLHVDVDFTYLAPTAMMRHYCEELREKSNKNREFVMNRMDERMHDLTKIVTDYFWKRQDENPWNVTKEFIAFDGMCCRLSHDINEKPHQFTMNELNEFGKYMVRILCGTMNLDRDSLRLTWGNTLYKMMELMKSVKFEDGMKGNMHVTSCHDDSLLAMMCSIYGDEMKEVDMEWPPYASHIIFELYAKNGGEGEKYVKVLYNGQEMKIFDGKACIALDELEEKWKDLMMEGNEHMNLISV